MDRLKLYYSEIKNVVLMIGVIGWVLFLVIPMPAFVIDLALSVTLGLSLIILIQSSSIDSWEKIRTFPLILLMATVFRIALNIATTRKIISGEYPGRFIDLAGDFIVRDMLAIGFVMFIILIVVQFIIAFGANRFGEVSARFSLDALPGKQMSIDNDLNQGVISAEQAKIEKGKLQQQVDFYGSLDGAGKYIKGDVWASVVMILVNLTVGLIVGVYNLGMSFGESLNYFTMLTIGDGVVNLICALMITVSGAIVLAKVEDREDEKGPEGETKTFIGKIFAEILPNSKNLFVVGFILIVLGLIGLPFVPLFLCGSALIVVGIINQKKAKEEIKELKAKQEQEREINKQKNNQVKVKREVDYFTIEAGYKLAPLFKRSEKDMFGNTKESIEDKTNLIRKIFANTLGVEIPKIKIRDNISLNPATKYVIKVKETVVASGDIKQDHVLAIPNILTLEEINGIKTKDPVNGQDAYWITEEQIEQATKAGYDVWNPLNIIAAHINDVLEKNVWQFVSLQSVSNLVDEIGENHPILKEKIEKVDDLHLLQKVIISLLKERVSIRDLPTIFEAFIESYHQSKEIDIIVSLVRERISRQICENYINEDGKLYLISINEEQGIAVNNHGGKNVISMDYDWQISFIKRLQDEKENAKAIDVDPVICVQRPELRPALSRMFEPFELDTPVISVYELPSKVDNKIVGSV